MKTTTIFIFSLTLTLLIFPPAFAQAPVRHTSGNIDMATTDFGALTTLQNGALFPNFRYPLQEEDSVVPSQFYLYPFSEIWVGDAQGNVASAYDASEDGGIDLGEWQATEEGAPMYLTGYDGRQEIIAQYATREDNDKILPFEILIDQHTFSWNATTYPEAQDFIVMKLMLTNLQSIDVEGIYVAIAAEWSVGPQGDLADFDVGRQASVVFDAYGFNPVSVAVALLEGELNAHRIIPKSAWGYSDANRSVLMSTPAIETSGTSNIPPGVYITMLSAGPYTIAARGTKSVIFAFAAGQNADALSANIDAARRFITVPDMLTAEPTDKAIRISWRPAIGNIWRYRIYRSNTSGSGYVHIGPRLISNAMYWDIGLENGVKYHYIVRAVDAAEQDLPYDSEEVSAIPDIKPETPSGLQADVNGTTIHLSWNPVVDTDIAGYRIYRNLMGEEPWTTIGEVNVPESRFADENIHPGILYHYTVTAVKQSGMRSRFSTPVVAQLDVPPPVLPQETLDNVIVAPNPYNPSTNGHNGIQFLNLTPEATIRIYTSAGELITRIEHISETSTERWDPKTDEGDMLSSGVYVYYITAFTAGREELKAHGKFAIVR